MAHDVARPADPHKAKPHEQNPRGEKAVPESRHRLRLTADSSWELLRAFAMIYVPLLLLYLLINSLVGKPQVLERLSSIEYARGLITYVLAVGTMLIAILVTVAGLLSAHGEEANTRFTRGKDVLMVLMGVLGTIVGFYYGSQTGEKLQKTAIATPLISNRTPSVGERIRLTSFLSGGVPPYDYEMSFENAPVNAPWKRRTGRADNAGWVVEEFELIDAKVGRLTYQIKVTDTKGATNSYTSDEATCIEVKAKQVEKPKGEPIRPDANTAGAKQGR